jgi:hypothetical protein
MEGDDRVRFCGECRLSVYNLSAMGRAEAEHLVREREGRLCVRFFRRDDGTMLTQDCPRGLGIVRRAARRGAAIFAARLAALVTLFLGVTLMAWGFRGRPNPSGGSGDGPLMQLILSWFGEPASPSIGISPGSIHVPPSGAVLGGMCPPVRDDEAEPEPAEPPALTPAETGM